MQTNSRYVLVGGSGFLGRRLRDRLVGDGAEVVVLGRSDGGRGERWRSVRWDPTEVGMWAGELEGAAAVVVLAGRRVDVRPTRVNVDELISSRVESVRTIGRAIADLTTPPASWIQLSSLAIFGDAGDDVLDESSPIAVDGPRQQVDRAADTLADVRAWLTELEQRTLLEFSPAQSRHRPKPSPAKQPGHK